MRISFLFYSTSKALQLLQFSFPPTTRSFYNPFAPEPPVSTGADPRPFYHLWHHQFQRSRTTFSTNLGRVKGSFKPYQNEHNSVKNTQEKAKNHVTLTWTFPRKSCSTTHLPFLSYSPKILKAFLKPFPPKWSLLNAQQEKKMWGKKSKKRGEERKKKVKAISKFCFLHMPELRKLTFCIWIRRLRSVHLVSGHRAKKVVSDSPGLVDFAITPENFVLI